MQPPSPGCKVIFLASLDLATPPEQAQAAGPERAKPMHGLDSLMNMGAPARYRLSTKDAFSRDSAHYGRICSR